MSRLPNLDRYARYLREARYKIHRDPLHDIRELLEIQQAQWGPRMRLLNHYSAEEGLPLAGYGLASAIVPNFEPAAAVTSTSSTTEQCLLTGGTGTTIPAAGASAGWMWIPQGQLRAPQFLVSYSSGIFTTAATTHSYTFTTRIGTNTTFASNSTLGATAAVVPGASITAGPWTSDIWVTVRTGGTGGSAIGMTRANMGTAAPAANTNTGLSGTATTANLDTTTAEALCPDVATNTTGCSIQLLQFVIGAWD